MSVLNRINVCTEVKLPESSLVSRKSSITIEEQAE